ncbi:helix-turn-helix transcriptional regulator [Amycolatopsis sp. H20-H5]|uniref:helix-turn-helix transcriptional regulator n=1 Tax=Amycolatopsis sp. H20-H5 TaxID=3046309 RepID=UPI002DB7ACF1|nr:hypothetical protein [Amycolatopsis sp. H20-H5]MEC3974275.1 hypothetical protein [Amycolatopsis sp. H20-H5]
MRPAQVIDHAQQRFVDESRKMLRDWGTVYDQARGIGTRDEGFTFLPPGAPTRIAANQARNDCCSELATIQLSGATVGEVLPGELDLLRRGVGVRTLVQHSVLPKLTVRSYVHKLTTAGGEVRALPHLWFGLAMFDRRVVLASASLKDEPSAGTVLIRNPVVVARVSEMFEHFWATATSDVDESGGRGELVSTQLRVAIARMLASGCTDEVSARRLGMSLRTYRRHVAHLMTDLGARTRFQAGLLVRDAGLIGVD